MQKFKTFEEAEKSLWVTKPDKEYWDRIVSPLFRSEIVKKAIHQSNKCTKGVLRFRSFEEAEQNRMGSGHEI